MKQLTETQIQSNYEQLLGYITQYIASPRKEKLLDLYKEKEEIIALAPASGKESYHNCYPGGYVEHVLNVIKVGLELNTLWNNNCINDTHTEEELVFALLNHDLGKIGDGPEPYYVPNPSEWHRKNQGALYAHNPNINYMSVPDRSLYILQQNWIESSFNEFIAIKIHDGLYDEANKSYFVSYNEDGKLKTNLPYIVHMADSIASRAEYLEWKNTETSKSETKVVKGDSAVKNRMNVLSSNATPPKSESASKIFDELFNNK